MSRLLQRLRILPLAIGVRSRTSAIAFMALQYSPYWIGASLCAVMAVFYAKLFAWSESLAFTFFSDHKSWLFVVVPGSMLMSAELARRFAPFANGSGIPQVIAAVEMAGAIPHQLTDDHLQKKRSAAVDNLLSLRIIIVKILGSCIAVAGGGVTGREGPMLQVAASLFHIVGKFWPKSFSTTSPSLNQKISAQSMVLAGGAAGLAAAFNTPLGGVIFAIEELAKVHISIVRTSVFHSVIIAGILAQATLGNYLYLGKPGLPAELGSLGAIELLRLMIMTAFVGALGAAFGRALVWALDRRAKLTTNAKILMTLLSGLAVASLVFTFGESGLGSGRTVILDLLQQTKGSPPFWLGPLRLMTNYFTYIGGVVGGIFAPSLATGAAIGAWLCEVAGSTQTPLWVLAGMIAFLTGVTRTPFTSLILVLEMTDSHSAILSFMLAAVSAQTAARFIDPISFYEHMSLRIQKTLLPIKILPE